MKRTAIAFPRGSRSYLPVRGKRPRRPTGASILAVFLDSQNCSPVDGSDLVVFLDLFPKVGKTTRPVDHSSTCTSDLYRRRVHLSRLCPCAGPGRAGQLPAPGRASERDRQQCFGAHDRAGLRHATGGRASERDEASAHTTGPGFGTPLAQLIPRRRIGFCRRFPRFLQLSPC